MERRIEQPDGNRKPLHFPEYTYKIAFLHRQDLCQRLFPFFHAVGQDHLPHCRYPVRLKKHMLGTGKTDTLRTEFPRYLCVSRGIRIGPDAHRSELIDPDHEGLEITGQPWWNRGNVSQHYLTRRAVQGYDISFLYYRAVDTELAGSVINLDLAAAGDAALTHAAGHHGRM